MPNLLAVTLCAALGSLAVTACGGPTGAPVDAPEPERKARVVPDAPAFLSAGAASHERWRFNPKADGGDDVRAANPEHYAITVPPTQARDVRPVAEWEPVRAVVLSFPLRSLTYQNITRTFVQVARHAASVADVWFFVETPTVEDELRRMILDAGLSEEQLDSRITFFRTPVNSVWVIDFGPTPLIDRASGSLAFADFRYFPARPFDDALPTVLGRHTDVFGDLPAITTYRAPLDIEGGNLLATSQGVCLTSERQLTMMSCARPEGCDDTIATLPLADLQTHRYAEQVRQTLREYAGCSELIILYAVTDDVTGHVDMFMKVLDDHRVVVGHYATPEMPVEEVNRKRLDANADFLAAYVLPDGVPFKVERMQMPGHRYDFDGPVAFTYLNAVFINDLNIWPAYDHEPWHDSRAAAAARWEELLPEMDHVWVDATELSMYDGAIHCITRTIPAAQPAAWVDDGVCTDGRCEAPDGGYDGACWPGDGSDTVCWGPEWVCECNDCDGGCEEDKCGDVTFTGCCDGSTLYYCMEEELSVHLCGDDPCGWDGEMALYNCGFTAPEPSGEHVQPCPWTPCTPRCDGRACGHDGCGGSCGSCLAGTRCDDGVCAEPCAACTSGTSGCNGAVAWVCGDDDGCSRLRETDCATSGRQCIDGACEDALPVRPNQPPPRREVATAGAGGDEGCAGGPGVAQGWLVWLMLFAAARGIVRSPGRRRRADVRGPG